MRKFLSVILLLAAFLVLTPAALAKGKSVRFIQVSDVHYVSENEQADV